MNKPGKRRNFPFSKILQICGVLLIAFSACPCLWVMGSVSPVVQYAVETGGNAALQISIPLGLAALINGVGLITLVISLIIKDKPPETPPASDL